MENNLANDNLESRKNSYNNESASLLPYVSTARYIIEKYINAYWKNDLNDWEYQSKEWWLAYGLWFFDRHTSVNQVISFGEYLNISPLTLYNDPNLPFFETIKKFKEADKAEFEEALKWKAERMAQAGDLENQQ